MHRLARKEGPKEAPKEAGSQRALMPCLANLWLARW